MEKVTRIAAVCAGWLILAVAVRLGQPFSSALWCKRVKVLVMTGEEKYNSYSF
ncbi:MAG: hypothetical protein V7629_12405 [Motiliproteus sp.]